MKHNYFNKAALACLTLCFVNMIGFAQLNTIGALYSTGGTYGAPGNQVMLGYYDSEFGDVFGIDSLAGDFSNFVDYADGIVYFHVGRASSHPDGSDVILAYSTFTDSLAAVYNINGAKTMQATGKYVAVLKAFGTDNGQYLEVFDKEELSTRVYADSLNINGGGLAYNDTLGKLYASYSTDESGEIAVYDFNNGITKEEVLLSDTMLKGIKQIFFDEENNWIVGAAKNSFYNDQWEEVIVSQRLFKYDLTLDSLTIVDVAKVPSAIKYVEGKLAGDFGQGLSVFDAESMFMIIEPLSFQSYTDFEVDLDNQELYFINTDYFSFGNLTRKGMFDTTIIDVDTVGISGSSLKLIRAIAPVAVDDYYEVVENGSIVFNPETNDLDEDTPVSALYADVLSQPVNGNISYDEEVGYTYQPNVDFVGLDTVYYTLFDNFGLSDDGMIIFDVSESNAVVELSKVELAVFPNPATDQLNLVLTNSNNATLTITNVQGQVIEVKVIKGSKTNVDISKLPVGYYIIEVVSNNEVLKTSFEKI
jgi:hypothetical protein